jgi:hypothetical protein
MTQDVAKPSYRGVLCMSCRQPIPLPAIVLSLVPPRGSEESTWTEHTERAFTLRCRACGRERPYRSVDVIELEGVPRLGVSYVRRPHGVQRQPGGLSRAANG